MNTTTDKIDERRRLVFIRRFSRLVAHIRL